MTECNPSALGRSQEIDQTCAPARREVCGLGRSDADKRAKRTIRTRASSCQRFQPTSIASSRTIRQVSGPYCGPY